MPRVYEFWIVHDDGSYGRWTAKRSMHETTNIPKNTVLVSSERDAIVLSELVHLAGNLVSSLGNVNFMHFMAERTQDEILDDLPEGDDATILDRMSHMRVFAEQWIAQRIQKNFDEYVKEFSEATRKALATLPGGTYETQVDAEKRDIEDQPF